MARPLQAPDREQVREGERAFFDPVVERMRNRGALVEGRVPGHYGALLHSPAIAYHVSELGRLVRLAGNEPGTYSHADREWVDQVICHDWGANALLAEHIPDALAVGVRLEAIEALRAGREEELTEHERVLAAYVREVVSGGVSDASFDAMAARLGQRGCVEFTFFILYLALTIRLIDALTGAQGLSNAEADALLADLRSGSEPIPKLEDAIKGGEVAR